MKILYLAQHGDHDNCDEEAIAFALRQLGHEVVQVEEKRFKRTYNLREVDADLCLFHKHEVVSELQLLSRKMPLVFWFFDMVRSIDFDPTLEARSQHRVRWLGDVLPHCLLGFMTDGDAVAADEHKSGKLRWLMQGMDERVAGFGQSRLPKFDGSGTEEWAPILFTGMVNHGVKRREHVEHLRERWGDRFAVLGDGGPKWRKHGRELADVFASVKIVVAPDGPSTDRYWSNRVYNTLGLGGFLLHPWCEGLSEQYDERELLTYESREHLDDLIECYLLGKSPAGTADFDLGRQALRLEGHRATMERHTYRHRCAELMRQVKEAL